MVSFFHLLYVSKPYIKPLEIPLGTVVAIFLHKVLTELQQVVIHNRLPHILHQVNQEVQVVVGRQTDSESLICLKQVP